MRGLVSLVAKENYGIFERSLNRRPYSRRTGWNTPRQGPVGWISPGNWNDRLFPGKLYNFAKTYDL